MKKTLLTTIGFPPDIGGVATYWANLLEFLPTDKVVVLASERSGDLDFDIEQSYLVLRKNLISKSFIMWPKWLPLLFNTAKVVRKEKIEQIIVGQVLPVGTVALILKWFLKIPYIISFHGMDAMRASASTRKKGLYKLILKNAQKVIVNSNFTKDIVTKHLPENTEIEMIYPCPNIKYQKFTQSELDEVATKYNLNNKKVILSVGRLVQRKGVDKTLEAMKEVIKKIPEAYYLIVGRGEYQSVLEDKINQLGLSDHAKIISRVDDKELAILYSLANLFTMAVRELPGGDVEGFGIVYLEAGLFNLPVIAGRSGGAVEAVEDNKSGLVVDPENPTAISNAIIKILNNTELATELGRYGRQRALDRFTWPKQSEKLEKFL